MARTSTRPRKTSPLNLTGAFDLFPKSYEIVRNNLGVFAFLFLFPFLVGAGNGVWTIDNERHLDSDGQVFLNIVGNGSLPWYVWGGFGVAFLFTLTVAVILQIMRHAAELEGSKGKVLRLGHLWEITKKKGLQMFGLYILVGLAIVIGLILLIIPGLIMIRRYFLSPYVLLDNNVSVWVAMEKSAAMSKPHSGSIWRIIGVKFLISLFGIIPLIGWLISFALSVSYTVAPALRYQELKKIA